jgi:UDP-3-O-[3-hydroxymyristoyl] glucosamine N-acyltransferase
MPVSLAELAVRFGCELRGDPATTIERVATLAGADARSVAFVANPRYHAKLAATHAGAVVLAADSVAQCPTAMLVCDNPHATYAHIAALLHPLAPLAPGVHASAVVAPTARIDPSAQVAPFCSVGAEVVIGPRCYIGPHCSLEEGAQLAQDVRLVARVSVGARVQIGARTVVQPGVVIGGDGFGFAAERGTWLKVPQVGSVRVGPDVEIGANTTIDRGAIEDTVIEEGVKLDNLIMIGHNVRVGAHTAIAACTGVSGSASIGKRCMIGGMVGFAGHINVADDVVVTGMSAVSHSIAKPGVYSGTMPIEEVRTWRKLVAHFKRGALLHARLRELERAAGVAGEPEEDEEQHD